MSARAVEMDTDHPDQWPPGLRVSFRTPNMKKVSRAGTPAEVLAVCLRHNLRQNNADHRHRGWIDPDRAHLNEVLAGPTCPEVAVELAAGIMDELGVVLPARVDAVAGVELVFQPPDGADTPDFWREVLAWVRSRYQHVVSVVIHRDQKRPHAHALMLPVLDGRYAGSALQSGDNGFPRQRDAFLRHVFAALGLQHERRSAAITKLAISAGKGAKTRAAAARRDAALLRQTGGEWVRVDVDARGCRAKSQATSTRPTSRIAQPSQHPARLAKVRRLWVQCFPAAGQPAKPSTPCPRPPLHAPGGTAFVTGAWSAA